MAVPSRMSTHRFPQSLRLRLRVAYATAWEALLETHTAQAMQFVHEFAPRLPVLEVLDLYFRVVAVPAPMEESVRGRALSGLDLDCLLPRMPLPTLRGWSRLRLDLLLENVRYRRRFHEKTMQLARMAGARAADDVQATHVASALISHWSGRPKPPARSRTPCSVGSSGFVANQKSSGNGAS